MTPLLYHTLRGLSPSSRRAWIEIYYQEHKAEIWKVALLAEGVDRNDTPIIPHTEGFVALLAEGVDRNDFAGNPAHKAQMSPSSRRAWIEILGVA